MSIPPFPSQDLAKLVLGYLAEEQLMTAYDEFLQASPYLDALQNEYDRIFMTSLKSILAEYRAVKIFVETCKPISLRRKVFQCTNLLDIVKLLVNYVDLNKLQTQEAADKACVEKQQVSVNANRSNTCETCLSSKLATCVCSKLRTSSIHSSHEASCQSSIETTPLADLPGNHGTARKKQVKVLDKDSVIFSDGSSSSEKEMSNVCTEENQSHSTQLKNDFSTVGHNSTVKTIDLADSRKKIEEFDNVLKLVLDKKNTVTGTENVPNPRVSNASTFQDFASGVSGGENSNVPDSSTSESLSTQASITKDYFKDNAITQKRQLLLQVSHENMEIQTYRRDKDKSLKYSKIKPKTDDQKVKIISDVKVTNKKKMLKNATSTPVTTTPLVQMRTIVINGNPAFSHAPVITKHTYTKDEIMAMPTLIVVPASGASKISTSSNCKPITSQSNTTVSTAIPTAEPLGPLVIDVPPITDIVKQPEVINKIAEFNKPDNVDAGIVKTVDLAKNASVPKDSISGSSKTPQVLPPVRKSSSTPRRTTHVRVLDFTTPRRILHESNNEGTSHTSAAPVEMVLSSSPNVSFVDTTVAENVPTSSNATVVYNNAIAQKTDGCDTDSGSAKENNTVTNINQPKKSNWDSDLRAIVAYDSALPSKITKRKSNSKKKKSDSKTGAGGSCSNTISPRVKKASKKRRIPEGNEDNPPGTSAGRSIPPEVTVRPTINIISGCDRVATDVPPAVQDDSNSETQNKDKDDDCTETPDGDRLSLQNVIGARLNISDLLETPYKQALYDIQMGTPRFLPDLPGEPLSDIKITNIPTPRFLDTPKPVQATPSSWSSRPTDYSSGGSYYKPDDQDYMPMPDLRCVVSSSSKEDITSDKSVDIPKDDERKSRPQRQCTKNVSYYRLANPASKPREADDAIDTASTCSDSTGPECKNKEAVLKTPRDRSRSNKSETKKRVASRKKKSPAVKEKPKPFVKIKPRQSPTKLTPNRSRKKTDTPGYPSPNKHRRNRIISKNDNITPPIAAPTKSRRKSSTPRKLHCTKSFNSENSTLTSPDATINAKPGQNAVRNTVPQAQESDTEQIALRWSDDGSQDAKINPVPPASQNECEDISKIQEYIQNTRPNQPHEGSFQVDLMKRGFDQVTAEKIKRDLLDTPSPSYIVTKPPQPLETVQSKQVEQPLERTLETDSSATNDLQIVQDDEEEEDEVELSVHECNEESQNYFVFQHNDTKEISQGPSIQLKDSFSMNICIDDGVTVRLRATQFSLPLDLDPIGVEEIDYTYNDRETEMAVNSISNMDRLYSPLKDSFKAQCYEIFDSTLTSIDTPLKATSPKRADCSTTVTDIVLEEDQAQKDKTELRKRKRSSGSVESTSDSKKTKYLLTSASIQNIDIESVLTKLHGP